MSEVKTLALRLKGLGGWWWLHPGPQEDSFTHTPQVVLEQTDFPSWLQSPCCQSHHKAEGRLKHVLSATGRSPNTHTHSHTKEGTERDSQTHAQFPIPKSSVTSHSFQMEDGWDWGPREPVPWNKNSRFIVFAGFHALNDLTSADFRLPMWHLEEGCRASPSQLQNTATSSLEGTMWKGSEPRNVSPMLLPSSKEWEGNIASPNTSILCSFHPQGSAHTPVANQTCGCPQFSFTDSPMTAGGQCNLCSRNWKMGPNNRLSTLTI